ncbi:DeoR/GlpR family transcriptional regulator of sugar metabolism [Okibacterium sp. HSC-33S16]|uniref:DeoR/GlpR family DNA-binding transcription regulator n=1 Tax=Okibacterium sp. HSC-33S16 TaxID=2910965 RepID=UPI00209FFFE3|nr:DeoR/GlpR family DNA-binding transcription regulator [Okibacterium sp. HSC-33S16]MCP2032825.1 DeoR/GlpR family transcriptional regulator of sugar metabolism [Okibacterium sp. HSC-33S16]
MSRYDFVREEAILDELTSQGRVTVNDLATRFGVSPVTVRKDLDLLEQRSLLRRVRGGAVATAPRDEGAFESRLRSDAAAKRAIAAAAASLVRDGDVIALDSSTTTHYLATELISRTGLVVVTNGIHLAGLLMERTDATVILPGGVLRRASRSVVGAFSDVLEGRGRLKVGFFGASSVSRSLGLLELSSEEGEAKKVLARSCDSVVGLFTAAKATGFGLHPFAGPERISALYTDEAVGPEFAETWRGSGVDVHIVPVPSRTPTPSNEAVPA